MKLTLLTENIYEHLYQDINDFRNTFDLAVDDPESLDQDADVLHTSLIVEELTELAQADNKIEQADAIIDSVYVLMGRLVHMGAKDITDNMSISYIIDLLLNVAMNLDINFTACWNEIHASNMSKVCRSQHEYEETESYYAKQGIKIKGVEKGNYIIAKCAEDYVTESKTIRTGKVLKSVYYRPANLLPLI